MTDEADKAGKPKPRRTGQRREIAKGKYEIRVSLGRDSNGDRHSHFEIFYGGARQAEDRIREIIRRHRAGEPIKANADTFGAFIDEWIESKRLSVAESSLETYKIKIESHVRPALGKKLLARVTADDIQRLYTKLHKDDGLSRSSVHYVHVVLTMIFKLAVKRKKLIGSPMAGVEIPKDWADEPDKEKARAMTAEQVARFLDAAEGDRFENFFKLAFHVGCRPGELLALKWADFDAAAKVLRINQNIVWRKAGDWYLKKPKTKLSRRTLPLTDATVAAIGRERKRQLEARMMAGKLWTDHGFIFADNLGEPFSPWDLLGGFKRVLKAAGLPEAFSPKTARHTMATLLIEGGTNVKAVSERLGHASVTTTLEAYTHVSPGMQADVSEEIERLLNAKK